MLAACGAFFQFGQGPAFLDGHMHPEKDSLIGQIEHFEITSPT